MKTRSQSKTTSRRGTRMNMRSRGTRPAASRQQSSSRGSSAKKFAGRLSRGSGSAQGTTDHDEIREWVEAHGGYPAIVKRTERSGKGEGVLRIDFPGFSRPQSLKPVSWKEWFAAFDEHKLAFLHQNKPESRFDKLVSRGSASKSSGSSSRGRGTQSRSRRAR